MRNTYPENIMEHSMQVACIAHALAVLGNKRFDRHYNVERAAVLALYHDVSEVITGDLPTPIKYINSEIHTAYKKLESDAGKKLLGLLPPDIQDEYLPLLTKNDEDELLWLLVKAADKLCAHIKSLEEMNAGNMEFKMAMAQTLDSVKSMHLPEADEFVLEFLPLFSCSLDELK